MRRGIHLVLALGALGALASGRALCDGPAPAVAPLPIETAIDCLKFADFGPVALSPDGLRVANTLIDGRRVTTDPDPLYHAYARTGASLFGVGGDVWITDVATGASRNLTGGKGNNWYPVWSPDGRHLAFYSDRDGEAKAWVWDATSDAMRPLSRRIVRPTGGDTILWTADSRSCILHVLPVGATVASAAELFGFAPRKSAAAAGGATVTVFTGGKESEKSTGWSVEGLVGDLVLVDLVGGRERTLAKGFRPLGGLVSPDGSQLLFTSAKPFAPGSTYQPLSDIVVVDLKAGAPRVVAVDVPEGTGRAVTWMPDSRAIVYLTGSDDEDAAKSQMFVVDAAGGAPRSLMPGDHPAFTGYFIQPFIDAASRKAYVATKDAIWAADLTGPAAARRVAEFPGHRVLGILGPSSRSGRPWSPDGTDRTIGVIARDDQTKRVSALAVDVQTGRSTVLFDEERAMANPLGPGVDVSRDGSRIVFLTEDAAHPENLWAAGREMRDRRRITSFNADFDKYRMGAVRILEWTGLDGQKRRGALLLPSDYREGSRYPTIVYPYGGADLSNRRFTFGLSSSGTENMQVFATRGYAVFLPDTKTHVGTPMRDIADSVLAGVAALIESGVADPARLGVTGHSYGGYSVLSLIVQTNIFRAAIARAGLGDLASNYAAMTADGTALNTQWAEGGQGMMGGTPWDQRARYIENSPYFYLDRVTTPLLIIHGGQDLRVPEQSAAQVFVALRRLGKEVVYARYDGEDHSELYWSYPNQIDYLRRTTEWFDKYLKAPEAQK